MHIDTAVLLVTNVKIIYLLEKVSNDNGAHSISLCGFDSNIWEFVISGSIMEFGLDVTLILLEWFNSLKLCGLCSELINVFGEEKLYVPVDGRVFLLV